MNEQGSLNPCEYLFSNISNRWKIERSYFLYYDYMEWLLALQRTSFEPYRITQKPKWNLGLLYELQLHFFFKKNRTTDSAGYSCLWVPLFWLGWWPTYLFDINHFIYWRRRGHIQESISVLNSVDSVTRLKCVLTCSLHFISLSESRFFCEVKAHSRLKQQTVVLQGGNGFPCLKTNNWYNWKYNHKVLKQKTWSTGNSFWSAVWAKRWSGIQEWHGGYLLTWGLKAHLIWNHDTINQKGLNISSQPKEGSAMTLSSLVN